MRNGGHVTGDPGTDRWPAAEPARRPAQVIQMFTTDDARLIRDDYIRDFVESQVTSRFDTSSAPPEVLHVTRFFVTKATRHLKAATTLALAGFHEDALIVGRAILELALHTRYMLAGKDDAERVFRAASFIYDGDRQRGTKHDQILKLKEEGKCASWIAELEVEGPFQPVTTPAPAGFTGLPSLERMANLLGGEWDCFYYFVYWSASKLAHPSGLGAHTYLMDADEDREAERAMALAFPMHVQMLLGVLDLPGLSDLHAALEAAVRPYLTARREG